MSLLGTETETQTQKGLCFVWTFLFKRPLRLPFLVQLLQGQEIRERLSNGTDLKKRVSLLNVDIKIFSKILANRLKHLLPSIVHPDQTGFIAGREARDNSIRALQLIHWARAHNNSSSYLILSTDAEKAFDRVDWDFVRAVLMRLGLGPSMLRWISALFTHPLPPRSR